MSSEGIDVTVVGSNFMDLIGYAGRLPKPGETLQGTDFQMGFGGKGANQCVAAARLGCKTAFVGKVGSDANGRLYYDNFKKEGVDVGAVTVEEGLPNGVALIMVGADNGENMIVIVPGATGQVSPEFVEAVGEGPISRSKVMIVQNEIPPQSTLKALQLGVKHRVTSIFNVAPAIPNLPKELFSFPDILCLNESEAEIVTGLERISCVEEAEVGIHKLRNDFSAKSVIITLGSGGALLFDANKGQFHHEPAPEVKAIDTTGAGDCFVGTLAYCLSRGESLSLALKKAIHNATSSVLKKGTQSSFPHSIISC